MGWFGSGTGQRTIKTKISELPKPKLGKVQIHYRDDYDPIREWENVTDIRMPSVADGFFGLSYEDEDGKIVSEQVWLGKSFDGFVVFRKPETQQE